MSAPADEAYVYVYATVKDRWGGTDEVYVGSMPGWAWSDPGHAREWKQSRRREILADRTSDPHGWRVTYATREDCTR